MPAAVEAPGELVNCADWSSWLRAQSTGSEVQNKEMLFLYVSMHQIDVEGNVWSFPTYSYEPVDGGAEYFSEKVIHH